VGLNVEGIFRLSGSQQLINMLKDRINCDLPVDLSTIKSVHDVGGLLKLFLRDLADPLLTFRLYDDFMAISRLDSKHKVQALLDLVNRQLPDEHLAVLKHLAIFINRVASHQETNKMTLQNLSVCFGPTILRSKYGSDVNIANANVMQMVTEAADANGIVLLLLGMTRPASAFIYLFSFHLLI
jgi:hypothetical protein